ncbi:MAG TPA: laccase domain-containing protein [Steroidobacteraceae bacterium]|nr:laccase domain-containing protein [Steroidobacteraceae bacterium]
MTGASLRRSVEVLVPDWPAPARVRAAITLRTGGVSFAPYDTLNLGAHVGDDPAAVAENRRRVRDALHLPSEPVWLEQIHGTDVAILDEPAPARDPDVVGATPPSGASLLVGAEAPGARGDEPRAPRRAAATATTHRVEVAAAHPADLTAAQRAGIAVVRRADAAVTHSPGLVCAIQVADCMPVLFAARDGTAVGAAHAGWRGLVGGVLEATVAALRGGGRGACRVHRA